MDNKRKARLLAIIAILVLLVAVVGATFAYFQAQLDSGASANVTVTTHSADQLIFTASSIVVGPVTEETFYEGAGDATGSGISTVVLQANVNAAATYCYTVGLNVTTNTFQYTTGNSTPVAELTISASKNGTPVLTNYDITEMTTGTVSFPTALNGSVNVHTLSAAADATVSDTWEVTATFVNLATDQSLQGNGIINNLDKEFDGDVVFTKISC